MRAPQAWGGQDRYSTWHYEKIVPMQRIEYIHNLADQTGQKIDPAVLGMPPDFPQDQRHEITFQSVGEDKTQLTVVEERWTVGQMREMSKLGMEQCLDKMTALFTKPA